MERLIVAAALLLGMTASQAADENFRAVVKFGSVCCGIDREAADRVSAILIKRKIEARRLHWGHEGEYSLCLALKGLNSGEQAALVGELNEAVAKATVVTKVAENIPCKGGW